MTMIAKLLSILLQLSLLEQQAVGGPCLLDLDISIIRSGNDWGTSGEFRPAYEIQRPNGEVLKNGDYWSNSHIVIDDYQGSVCENINQARDFARNAYWENDYQFNNCGGDFRIWSRGLELGNNGNEHTWIWYVDEKFKCDGSEFKKRGCSGGYGGEVLIKCTNLYAIPLLWPAFIKFLNESHENQNYNNLHQKYQELVSQMRQADLSYDKELDACGNTEWTKHYSCQVNFFQPMIGVIASFAKQSPVNNLNEIEKWTSSEFFSQINWNDRDNARNMINLMKFYLSKEQLDDKFFTREMIYTRLHRANPDDFPWRESPFGRNAEQWYQNVRNAQDAPLRQLFDLNVDQQVKDFCVAEEKKSLLCSVLAAKSRYDTSMRYLPQSNPSGLISLSAYVGDDGLYQEFKKELDTLLLSTTITDKITQLGGQISDYFQTMARFDNAIAKADVGYLNSSIAENNKRLKANTDQLNKLVEDLKYDRNVCVGLNILETVLTLIVSVAIGVATGGAGFAVSAASLPAALSASSSVINTIEAVKITTENLKNFRDIYVESQKQGMINAELEGKINNADGTVDKIMKALETNAEKIDNMTKIQNAMLDRTDFNSIQKEVDRFLYSYNDYTPAVTKDDLTKLNIQYEQMFDSFETTFSNGGFLCSLIVGGQAAAKTRQAKAVWAVIYTLLEDVHGKQFELIDAIRKVVRSKLDEAAAKKAFDAGVNVNFEIIVGHMLAVRVAAQQVCDTFKFLSNDQPDPECTNIGSSVFLSKETRASLDKIATQLQNRLVSYPISTRYAFIPVGNSSSTREINWDALVTGNVTEFQVPLNESSILTSNEWIDNADQLSLLKSVQIFIPNSLVPNPNNDPISIRFNITAFQDNVTVNGEANAQRYTIKSHNLFTTEAAYRVNVKVCGDEIRDNLFDQDSSKYCITQNSGDFGNNLKLPLPVSMYSKFRIQLKNGYNEASLPILLAARPVGNTLKLRARLVLFMNSGGGKTRTRTRILPPKPLNTESCGPGQYHRHIDAKKLECVDCPPGSVPYAHGSYCISEEAARLIAKMTG